MRFLLLLQWSLLFILVIAHPDGQDCEWKIPTHLTDPKKPFCIQIIKFKVYDDKQALATCLEHFPTTFVEGTIDPTNKNEIKCKVYRQFQCDYLPSPVFSLFDKCYTFKKDEVTMTEYKANKAAHCKEVDTISGSIPLFLTMTQAKHIAMKAHREGISKIWVNVNKDGKTIEKSGDIEMGTMLYKEPFKLHEGHYWVGDKLKVTPKDDKGKHEVPANENVDYLFFRSKTDHWNNLIQGSFERATEDSTASIICEYPAKIVPNHQKYCERMGEKGLGLNAMYDNSNGKLRCVYTTLTKFPLLGTEAAIKSFTGCKETPSKEHSSGLDDGTAEQQVYTKLTTDKKKGTYRFAAIKVSTTINNAAAKSYAANVRKHCDPNPYTDEQLKRQRHPYEIFDHFLNRDFGVRIKAPWADNYPKDECSDFPNEESMHSNTLAISNGKVIDVPTPVLLPVICSIASNVDCKIQKHLMNNNVCPSTRKDLFCKDVQEYQSETKLYAKCECPLFHVEAGSFCRYTGLYPEYKPCGLVFDMLMHTWRHLNMHVQVINDRATKVVVRNGCTLTLYQLTLEHTNNVIALGPLEVGEHEVPNDREGTLRGWDGAAAASSFKCSCYDPK